MTQTYNAFQKPADYPVSGVPVWQDWLWPGTSDLISFAIDHDVNVYPHTIFDPEHEGARYNIATHAQAVINSAAIEACKAKMPHTGGRIRIRDELHIFGSVTNPVRTIAGSPRIIPFGIEGAGIDQSSLINIKPGEPAIDFRLTAFTAFQDAVYVPKICVENLRVFSQGGGIYYWGLGKNLLVQNVEVGQCFGNGIMLEECYGGTLNNVFAIANRGTVNTGPVGIYLKNCNEVLLNCTPWNNYCRGILLENCNAIRGRLYLEGNKGFGMDAINSGWCEFGVHLEWNQMAVAGWFGDYPSVRLRDCTGPMIFHNWTHDYNNSAFDCDEVSRSQLIIDRQQDFPAHREVAMGETQQAGTATFAAFWQSGFEPTLVWPNSSTMEMQVPAGMFNHVADPQEAKWIRVFHTGFSTNMTWVAGDHTDISFDVELDQAGVDFYAANPGDAVFFVTLGTNTGGTLPIAGFPGQLEYVRNLIGYHFHFRFKATQAGDNCFLYFFPTFKAGAGNIPPVPIKVYLKNVKIFKIPSGSL